MSDIFPAYLQTNVSLFIFLSAAIVAFVAGYFMYRSTTPPVSKGLRIFLAILRGAAVAAIIILLFAPEITLVWNKNMPRKIVLALDRSSSMGIADNDVKRIVRAESVAGMLYDNLTPAAQVTQYSFNTDTISDAGLTGDTTFGGTDFVRTLGNILDRSEQVDDVIILSDGRVTVGQDPLYSQILQSTRLNTIGFGDTLEATDLLITDVKSNALVYQGKPAKIQVDLMMKGGKNLSSVITLSRNGKVIEARNVHFGAPGAVNTEVFDVIPDKSGVIKYTLEVAKTAGERILSNNVFIHAVEVRKGKINVGLIAGQIDYDLKFLRLLLGQNEEIELRSSVLTSANRNFYSEPAEIIQNSDLLVFYNLQLSGNVISELTGNIPGSIPVMFILNQRIDQNAGDFIRKFFPLQTLTIAADPWESQVIRTTEGKLNPQLSVFNNENQNNAFWEKCPPVIIPYEWPHFGPQVQVWLESRNPFSNEKGKFPVLTTYRSKNRKSLLLLGSGFWRWHFSFSDDQVFKSGWSGVLSNMVRWLTSGITDKTVNLTSGKKNYEMGQSVGLKTQVFDGAFNPLDDALVQTRVSGPAGTFEIETVPESDGLYNSQFVAFKDGEYRIESVAWYNDVMLGRDSIDLVVTAVNREFMVTTQNDLFLRQLSEKSGASYFSEQRAQELLDKIDLSEKHEQISKTFELWHKMVVLLIVVLLLSLEWLLRKRSGLI